MSTQSPIGFEATDRPDEPTPKPYRAQNVLKTIVSKALPYDELPFWHEREQAVWAVADTIERVAPEAGR